MVKIIKIERKDNVSENFLITFVTDNGDTMTIERNYHHIANERLLKELVWNLAQKNDYIKSFTTITKPILITKADINPIPIETEIDTKELAVIELAQYKRNLELGLITQQQYDAKLQEVKTSLSKIG
jgi:hypothetical protein